MKKNSFLYNDEIDLINVFTIIWDGKTKILLITIISFLVGFGYNYQIPKNYLNSLTISTNDSFQLTKLENIARLMQSNQSNKSNQSNQSNQLNQLILDKFIDEFRDYKEFLFSIKNSRQIQKNISKLRIKDQELDLFKYVKLLEIVELKTTQNNKNYIINFKWHDPDEAKKILQDTLNATSNNLKKKIQDDLLQSIEFKKKFILSKNNERLDFLEEQRIIAKELNIKDNKLDIFNLYQSSVLLNINNLEFADYYYQYYDLAYYLRGYKLIEREIELIQNRHDRHFKLVKQEIDNLKVADINLVDYNISLIVVKSLNNTRLILVNSILLGLIIGIFYVLISNTIQSQTASKKNK
jgi:LPS O-antigen subunit length determinant protein (WzzB/FepE family)